LIHLWLIGAVATGAGCLFQPLGITEPSWLSAAARPAPDPSRAKICVATLMFTSALALLSTVTFSVTAAGDAPLYYQWLKNGTNIPSATATNFIIASAQTNDAGNYSVVVTNAYGSATSAVAALIVKLPVSPVFSTPILQVGNTILINFTGEPGSNYMIYGSTNLKTWDTITTVCATNGAGSVSIPMTTAQRFFKALLTP